MKKLLLFAGLLYTINQINGMSYKKHTIVEIKNLSDQKRTIEYKNNKEFHGKSRITLSPRKIDTLTLINRHGAPYKVIVYDQKMKKLHTLQIPAPKHDTESKSITITNGKCKVGKID